MPKKVQRKPLITYPIITNYKWLQAESQRTGKSMSAIVNELITAKRESVVLPAVMLASTRR